MKNLTTKEVFEATRYWETSTPHCLSVAEKRFVRYETALGRPKSHFAVYNLAAVPRLAPMVKEATLGWDSLVTTVVWSLDYSRSVVVASKHGLPLTVISTIIRTMELDLTNVELEQRLQTDIAECNRYFACDNLTDVSSIIDGVMMRKIEGKLEDTCNWGAIRHALDLQGYATSNIRGFTNASGDKAAIVLTDNGPTNDAVQAALDCGADELEALVADASICGPWVFDVENDDLNPDQVEREVRLILG